MSDSFTVYNVMIFDWVTRSVQYHKKKTYGYEEAEAREVRDELLEKGIPAWVQIEAVRA